MLCLQAFDLALSQAALTLPGLRAADVLFFDDSTRNISGATACGIRTVLVGSKGASTAALKEVASLHELRAAMPELWDKKATLQADCQYIMPVDKTKLGPSPNGNLTPSFV